MFSLQVLEEQAGEEYKREVLQEKIAQTEQAAHAAAVAAYKGSRKTEVRAGAILERFYRIEELWDKLREYAFEVGRDAVSRKRVSAAQQATAPTVLPAATPVIRRNSSRAL